MREARHSIWTGQNTGLGWSDPTFAHGSVAKVIRGRSSPVRKVFGPALGESAMDPVMGASRRGNWAGQGEGTVTLLLHPAQLHPYASPRGEANLKKSEEMTKVTATPEEAAQNLGEAGATPPLDAQRVTGPVGSLPPLAAWRFQPVFGPHAAGQAVCNAICNARPNDQRRRNMWHC
jgi:hypothetical protein